MMGPDYAWWHGMYEVGKHFYMKFIPAVLKLDDKKATAYIETLLKSDWHKWFRPASNKETIKSLKSGEAAKLYRGLSTPPWNRVLKQTLDAKK